MQKLIRQHGSGLVTLPQGFLERDGLLNDDGVPRSGQSVIVDRLGERCYLVRAADGDVPDVEDCEVIERMAAMKAQSMLTQDALGRGVEG